MHQNHIFQRFALDHTGQAYIACLDRLDGGEGACCPSPKDPTTSPLSAVRASDFSFLDLVSQNVAPVGRQVTNTV